jgi:hypothetical protein
MGSFVIGGAIVAIVLMYFGLQRKSSLRSGARFALGILTTVSGGITAFLLYGSISWGNKGGGVLFLFALPTAFITWLLASALFASAKHEAYYDLPVDEKIAHNVALADGIEANLRKELTELMKEREKFFLSSRRRSEIDARMEQIRTQMKHMNTLRAAVQKKEIYAGDEP